jgi:hypothetical protein
MRRMRKGGRWEKPSGNKCLVISFNSYSEKSCETLTLSGAPLLLCPRRYGIPRIAIVTYYRSEKLRVFGIINSRSIAMRPGIEEL